MSIKSIQHSPCRWIFVAKNLNKYSNELCSVCHSYAVCTISLHRYMICDWPLNTLWLICRCNKFVPQANITAICWSMNISMFTIVWHIQNIVCLCQQMLGGFAIAAGGQAWLPPLYYAEVVKYLPTIIHVVIISMNRRHVYYVLEKERDI